MKTLARISHRWWFFAIIAIAQITLIPYADNNFNINEIGNLIYTTLSNSLATKIGGAAVYFQIASLSMIILLIVFRNRVKRLFAAYVTLSYVFFAIAQNIAVTEKYGLSMVTLNVVSFLFVAFVWAAEFLQSKNDYSFANMKWRYSWMIALSLFAYLCPLSASGFDFNPALFFQRNSATAFCLMTPLFLTILTLNIPRINVVTYRITALIGVIIGMYNMLSFLNPHTINVGILHIPLLSVSLYSLILSYRIKV